MGYKCRVSLFHFLPGTCYLDILLRFFQFLFISLTCSFLFIIMVMIKSSVAKTKSKRIQESVPGSLCVLIGDSDITQMYPLKYIKNKNSKTRK